MPTNYSPTPTAYPGGAVSRLVDGDPVNEDNLYKEASPGGTPKITLALLLDYIAGIFDGTIGLLASSPITISTPVSETRVMNGVMSADPSVALPDAVYGRGTFASTGGAGYFYLDVPHGVSLTSIEVDLIGAGGHGALPVTMPSITWTALDVTTNSAVASTGGTQSDTSANTTAYQAAHTVTLSGGGKNFPYTMDRTKVRVGVAVSNEDSTNATSGLKVIGIRATWTRSKIGSD